MHTYAPTIDATGARADDFPTTLAKLQDDFRSIYGDDVYLGNDSQDGQWLGVLAKAISDCGAAFVSVYNAFSPATAQGNGLSSVVKINGLSRALPSFSTCDLTLVGVATTPITNGLAEDTSGNVWALPALVTIPSGGEITVTATCRSPGSIAAAAGTITKIKTPVFGWQSVTNAGAAVPGNPVETDAALRARQTESVAGPSQTVLDGVMASIAGIPGVARRKAYENNTNAADGNGIPAKNVAIFVEGGDQDAILDVIGLKMTPGVPMQGAITKTYVSPGGSSKDVRFARPTAAVIHVALTLQPLTGWSTDIQPIIAQSVADYINTLPIGQVVRYFEMVRPAMIVGSPYASSFSISSMTIQKNAGAPGATDLAIDYHEVPSGETANVTFTIL